MEWLSAVAVALIGGPMMWMLHRFDRRNSKQHADNGDILTGIKDAVTENRDDIREVRDDVRDLKADHRQLKYDMQKIDFKLDEHVRGKSDV